MNESEVERAPRLLLEATLTPVQGVRFQPTGFPDLGAAEYTAPDGTEMLLVESAQSMANHLESVCWDEAKGDLMEALRGLPYVRSKLSDGRETNSILEAHRLNSPYIIGGRTGKAAFPELAALEKDPANIRALAKAVFKYDPNSVLHGVFLEKIAGGLRLRRLVSSFIEARGVRPADSGGIKADRVDPTGKLGGGSAEGYGHVPFHRREYSAEQITAYFNIDLAQLRAYGLGTGADRLLLTLALYKIRSFLERGTRLRTACDLRALELNTTEPSGFVVPVLADLERDLPDAIGRCQDAFTSPPVTEIAWEPSKKAKAKDRAGEDAAAEELEGEAEEEEP